MFETPGSRVVADLLVKEGLAVAKAEGVNIPSEEADHILEKVTRVKTDDTKYSHHHPGDSLATGEQDLDVRRRPQKEVFLANTISGLYYCCTGISVYFLAQNPDVSRCHSRQSEVDFINGRVVALAKK